MGKEKGVMRDRDGRVREMEASGERRKEGSVGESGRGSMCGREGMERERE